MKADDDVVVARVMAIKACSRFFIKPIALFDGRRAHEWPK